MAKTTPIGKRRDVLPNGFARGRDFEQAAGGGFRDERVAVGQSTRPGAHEGIEGEHDIRLILPLDLAGLRVNFNNSGKGWRTGPVAAVVENQNSQTT